eukprot:COSAG05_NODE_2025_length_3676_cov_2.492715_2_plen_420_part_00
MCANLDQGNLQQNSNYAWCVASTSTSGQYYQMDAGSVVALSGVITRGKELYSQQSGYVRSYSVKVSTNGVEWTDVPHTSGGNTDFITTVVGSFSDMVLARYVRIYPETFHQWITMRAGLIICGSSHHILHMAASGNCAGSTYELVNASGSTFASGPIPIGAASEVNFTLQCEDRPYRKLDSGELKDPGGDANYDGSTTQAVTLTCAPGATLSAEFTYFNTEECCDTVELFSGNDTSAPSLGVFSGTLSPLPSFTPDVPQLHVYFTSDSQTNRGGYILKWECEQLQGCTLQESKAVGVVVAVTDDCVVDWQIDGVGFAQLMQPAYPWVGPQVRQSAVEVPAGANQLHYHGYSAFIQVSIEAGNSTEALALPHFVSGSVCEQDPRGQSWLCPSKGALAFIVPKATLVFIDIFLATGAEISW